MSLRFARWLLPVLAASVLTAACDESTGPAEVSPGGISPAAMTSPFGPVGAGPRPVYPADTTGWTNPSRRLPRYAQ
ncbi:MAG: hypothetical protein H0V43_13565 [Gemmatimonadales bacterium]|nr:hypothetical protein [Gemmatimonadales bacterium]